MAKINVSFDDWVMSQIIMPSAKGNKSARIQELVIKGAAAERMKTDPFADSSDASKTAVNGLCGSLSLEPSHSPLWRFVAPGTF